MYNYLSLNMLFVAVNNMHPQLRRKPVAIEYSNLAQLSSKASKVDQCIVEKEQRRCHRARPRGPQMVFVIIAIQPRKKLRRRLRYKQRSWLPNLCKANRIPTQP